MLGNNADAFFTTAMPTTVVSGNRGNQYNMPGPRELSSSATGKTFIPGIGGDGPAMAGLGETPPALRTALMWGGLAALLLLTPMGKKLLAKAGL